jgi:hypothetical protein
MAAVLIGPTTKTITTTTTPRSICKTWEIQKILLKYTDSGGCVISGKQMRSKRPCIGWYSELQLQCALRVSLLHYRHRYLRASKLTIYEQRAACSALYDEYVSVPHLASYCPQMTDRRQYSRCLTKGTHTSDVYIPQRASQLKRNSLTNTEDLQTFPVALKNFGLSDISKLFRITLYSKSFFHSWRNVWPCLKLRPLLDPLFILTQSTRDKYGASVDR